jgi:hypothetical protein
MWGIGAVLLIRYKLSWIWTVRNNYDVVRDPRQIRDTYVCTLNIQIILIIAPLVLILHPIYSLCYVDLSCECHSRICKWKFRIVRQWDIWTGRSFRISCTPSELKLLVAFSSYSTKGSSNPKCLVVQSWMFSFTSRCTLNKLVSWSTSPHFRLGEVILSSWKRKKGGWSYMVALIPNTTRLSDGRETPVWPLTWFHIIANLY